jgi:8-oxoguanine deaminase
VHYQDLVQAEHQMLPVEFCESVGWVGPDVWYAHLVKLDPQEIALLGRTRTGIAPVRELEAAGAQISIDVVGAASTVKDVVRWGSAGGARLMGLDAVGTLAPGQAADIAIYGLDRQPRYRPARPRRTRPPGL